MSKADKMFEELGFVKKFNHESFTEYVKSYGHNDNEVVVFDWLYGNYEFKSDDGIKSISMDLHKAIHEKLKEGGLLDE